MTKFSNEINPVCFAGSDDPMPEPECAPFAVLATPDQLTRLFALQAAVNANTFRGHPPLTISLKFSAIRHDDNLWRATITPVHVTGRYAILKEDGTDEVHSIREEVDFSFIDSMPPAPEQP